MTDQRHPNDGKPYYCTYCGSGYSEFVACEDGPCELEADATAQSRRERWLAGIAGRKAKQASPRATVSPLNIQIRSIPHDQQRYDTCGDYYTVAQTLVIAVSETSDRREMLLVAIHELIEWALCEAKGVTNEEIDKFDLNFEKGITIDNSIDEPGDNPRAPYYKQHQFATGIERILAAELGVDWLTYERHIEELSK